jgi:hypothetical protein
MEFQNKSDIFLNKGAQTTRPVDKLGAGKYLRLYNVRSYVEGAIEGRGGQLQVIGGLADTPTHSIGYLNSPAPSSPQTEALIVGAGTKLYTSNSGLSALTLKDSGYSGRYLSMIPHRPTQSPEPWMYVADGSRMRKVRVDGTNYPIGIAPPNTAPSADAYAGNYVTIDDFEAVGAWAIGGTAGAITAAARLSAATTIASILYDTGSTGMACVEPSTLDANIQPGMLLIIGGATETKRVEEVHPAIDSTTIASIVFDSGASGLCTIQLTASSPMLERNSVIRLNSGGAGDERVRVLSVTVGPDGISSIRVSTVNTHAAGHTVTGIGSFRIFLSNTHAAAESLATNKFGFTVGAGTGYIGKTAALALTTSANRPISDDDELHISLRIDDPSLLTEARILLDVDSATNDFTRNYYYFPVQPNLLTQALQGTVTTLTAQQRIIGQQQIFREPSNAFRDRFDRFNNDLFQIEPPDYTVIQQESTNEPTVPLPPGQTSPGNSQWTELRIKVKDLIRVGADTSRTLHNVAALRLSFVATGSISVDVDAMWIGGTYGPDNASGGAPYLYCYTARSRATGATSNPSPPTRSGIIASRSRITGSLTQHTDTQVDVLDVYRFGGALSEWHYVTTVANGATPTFTDDYSDDVVAANPLLVSDNFQPFPIIDTPRTGTCDVTGTKVTRTGGTDSFNTSWGRGSLIKINGVAYTLYNSPTSTTLLELNENAGTQSGVTFELPEARILGQPLPFMWGPFGGGFGGVFTFACGSAQQPGTLFITKGNNPDACNYTLEITSGSERLVNGCVYAGRAYVWSTDRMFAIEPVNGGEDFIAREIANSTGLYAPYGLVVGEKMYWVGRDGIYESSGDSPVNITDEDFFNIFPHDTIINSGADYFGITPLPLGQSGTDPNDIRLGFYNNTLYVDYKTITYNTLVYDTLRRIWSQDVYGSSTRAVCHAGAGTLTAKDTYMGATNGGIYKLSPTQTTDNGTAFTCAVTTGFDSCGDSRLEKQFADIMLDADYAGATIAVDLYKDNDFNTVIESFAPTAAGRSTQILNLNSGAGRLAKSVGLALSWSGANKVRLYEWQPSFIPKGQKTSLRFTDWDNAGLDGDKHVYGFILEADTFNVAKSIQVQYDGSNVGQTFSVTHNGQTEQVYSFSAPIVAKELRFGTASSVQWIFYKVRWLFAPYAELATLITEYTDDGVPQPKLLRGVMIEGDTGGANVNIEVQYDGDTFLTNFTYNSAGRKQLTFGFSTPTIATLMRMLPGGLIRNFKQRWIYDVKGDFARLTTDWDFTGDLGAKRFYGFIIDADTQNVPVNLVIQKDGSTSTVDTISVQLNGETVVSCNTVEFVAHCVRIVPSASISINKIKWLYEPYPEFDNLTPDFSDLGYAGAKRITGVVIEGDTAGSGVTVNLQKDGSTSTVQALTVNQSGRTEQIYSLTPFLAFEARLVPTGNIRLFKARFLFEQYAELATLVPDFDDLGQQGDKRINGIIIDADTSESSGADAIVQVQKDGSTSVVQSLTLTHAGRKEVAYALTPFVAANLRLVPTENLRVFSVKWLYEKYPENVALIPDYDDLGLAGDKRITGVVIEADTAGSAISVTVLKDGGVTAGTLSVNQNGKGETIYVLTPFIAKEVKLSPAAAMRSFKAKWLYEPYPELAALVPDFSDLGAPGDKRVYAVTIEADTTDSSAGDAIVNVQKNGTNSTVQALTLTHAGRKEITYDLTPFAASTLRLLPTEALRLFGVKWIFDKLPESAILTPDFTDLGVTGDKRFAGVIIEADTGGAAISVDVQSDGGTVQQTLSVTKTVRGETVFPFTTPFISKEIRLVPSAAMRSFTARWLYEPYPELAAIIPDFADAGEAGDKRIYGVVIEADTTDSSAGDAIVNIQINGVNSTQQSLTLTHAGRKELTYALTPFTASTVRILPTEALRLFNVKWLYEKLPENAALLLDYTDLGVTGDKRFTGIILEGDTAGATISVPVVKDGGTTVQTLSVLQSQHAETLYTFSTPFIAKLVKVAPAAAMRNFKARWLFEPYPELAPLIPDFSDLGAAGDKRVFGVTIEADTAESSAGDAIVNVQINGVNSTQQALTLTHAGRKEVTYDLTPFAASTVRLVPAEALRLFNVKWIFDKLPENAILVPDFSDLGVTGDKRFSAVIIEADTAGATVSVDVQSDGATVQQTLSVTKTVRGETVFPITTPFISKEIRLVPAAAMRSFTSRWIYEKYPENAAIIPDFSDAGEPGDKRIYGVTIEADTTDSSAGDAIVNVQINGVNSTQQALTLTHAGRKEVTYALVPFTASTVRLFPAEALRLFNAKWLYEKLPENAALLLDYTDLGVAGDKRFTGIVIEGDTAGSSISVPVIKDGGATVQTLSVNQSGRAETLYTFTTPFISKLVKVAPGAAMRNFKARWLFEPYPELAALIPDFTDLNTSGDKRIYGVTIEADTTDSSAGDAVVNVQINGANSTQQTLTLTHAGRKEITYALTPFAASTVRLFPAENLRIFGAKWLFEKLPENAALIPDYDDLGVAGDKRFSAIIVEGDTAGADVTITVLKDGGATAQAFTLNQSGRSETTFPFTTPFISKLVKVVPGAAMRGFNVRWIYEPYPELAAIIPDFSDLGEPGDKRVFGITIEADTSESSAGDAIVNVQKNGVNSTQQVLTLVHAGRKESTYALTPFVASSLRLYPTEALRLFSAKWLYERLPGNAAFTPDFSDLEFAGSKQFRGIVIEGDTSGGNVSLQIQRDGGTVQQTLTLNLSGRGETEFALDPFFAKEVRIVPQSDCRIFSLRWIFDRYPESAAIWSDWSDHGRSEPKYIRGIILEADSANIATNIDVLIDGGTVAQVTIAATHNNRQQKWYPFATPFYAKIVRLAPQGAIRLFGYQLVSDPSPELTRLISAWTDDGYSGPKRIQGFTLDADSSNAAVSLSIRGDNDVEMQAFSVTHNGRNSIDYALTTPAVAHMMRCVPAGDIRIWGFRWIYDKYPENAALVPDFSNEGYTGAKRVWGIVIEGDTSGANVSVQIQKDGSSTAIQTLTLNLNGRGDQTFALTPFTAFTVRAVPLGAVRNFSIRWLYDQYSELSSFTPDFSDLNEPGDKRFKGIIIEADTSESSSADAIVLVQKNGSTSTVQSLTLTQSGRQQQAYALTPFVASEVRIVPQENLRIWRVQWLYERYPDNAALIPDFTDLGFAGSKQIRGVVIEADTLNATVSVQVQKDGGSVAQTLSVLANGRVETEFALTPFYTKLARLVPAAAWRLFNVRWIFDQYPENAAIYSDWTDHGEVGCKYVRGVWIECDTANVAVSIDLQSDGGTVSATISATHNGMKEIFYPFSSPFYAYETRLVPAAACRIRKYKLLYDTAPDLAQLISGWSDDNNPGDKWLQGFVLDADTSNSAVSLSIRGDGDAVLDTISVNHNGRTQVDYSLTDPVITHMMRCVPSGAIRIWGFKWVYELEPPLTKKWITQPTTHDLSGYQHLRDCYIAHRSTSDITLTVTVDGVDYTYTITNSGGLQTKSYVPFQQLKGKEFQYKLTSSVGFRLYQRDCEVRVGQWGRGGNYSVVNPFGHPHREHGALI